MSKILAVAMTVALFAGACGDADELSAIQHRVELRKFDNCQQLESYIKLMANKQMEQRLLQQLKSAKQWAMPSNVDGGAMSSADAGAAGPPINTPGGSDAPVAHTETNIQEKDVDEPDFIKNDGTRILVLSGNTLFTAKSWPPSALDLVGKLKIEGSAKQMFLKKDQVVVFSAVSTSLVSSSGTCMSNGLGCSSSNATKITVVDVSDLGTPAIVSEAYMPGRYSNARRVGAAVRLVLTDSFRWPSGVKWYLSNRWNMSPSELDVEYMTLIRKNRQLINERPLSAWLPTGKLKKNGMPTEMGYACGDFFKSNASVRLGVASVVSLNLDNLAQQPSRTSIIGEVDEIYASKSSLYIASQHWWWSQRSDNMSHVYLHKFDITNPTTARYVASGGVEGNLLDQFSMDEHKGFFRIATTITRSDPASQNGWQTTTTNRVSVLAEKSGHLSVVGQTKDLAKGERIFAVRFQGNRGYVVTFRQVDPLYTMDLSNPKAPRVVGELKVPGFSTYIHPIDDDNLLTIGIYQPETTSGWGGAWGERRVRLTIFDVSDFKNPKEKFTHLIGTASGSSTATYEHKAFNYFAKRGLLAIPFSDYQWDGAGSYWDKFVSDVRVYSIDVKKGITPHGSLSFKDVYKKNNTHSWYQGYSPWIKRSVMATDKDGKDYIYAIADVGIRVSDISSIDLPIRTIFFR